MTRTKQTAKISKARLDHLRRALDLPDPDVETSEKDKTARRARTQARASAKKHTNKRASKLSKVQTSTPRLKRKNVTVKVGKGDEQRSYYLRKSLLAKHSKFFREAIYGGKGTSQEDAAVEDEEPDVAVKFEETDVAVKLEDTDGGFKSGQEETTIELPEVDAEIFEFFQHFIPKPTAGADYGDTEQCWQLGDQLSSTTFKDATTDALISSVKTTGEYPTDMHQTIYPISRAGSGIRKLLVHIAIWFWKEEDMESWQEKGEQQPEFFYDMAVELRKKDVRENIRPQDAPFLGEDTCMYHEHVAEGKPCYKTKKGFGGSRNSGAMKAQASE